MAYLSKEQYERRNEAAAGRVLDNIEIAKEQGMTDEQGELIFDLCRVRHELHCNASKLIKSDECAEWSIVRELIDINRKMLEVGMEQPVDEDEIYDIDCIDTCYYIGCNRIGEPIPDDHDSKEFQDWYDKTYDRASADWEKVNTEIEHYLGKIDEKYGTHLEPTGALRIF